MASIACSLGEGLVGYGLIDYCLAGYGLVGYELVGYLGCRMQLPALKGEQ